MKKITKEEIINILKNNIYGFRQHDLLFGGELKQIGLSGFENAANKIIELIEIEDDFFKDDPRMHENLNIKCEENFIPSIKRSSLPKKVKINGSRGGRVTRKENNEK